MRPIIILTQVLLIVGDLNRLPVGAFDFDPVAAIFGWQGTVVARIVYMLVGLSAIGHHLADRGP